MSRIQKLYVKIRNNPQQTRYADLCTLAEAFGFRYKDGKGSHKTYTRKGVREILNFQNVQGMAKPYQVKQFLKIVDDYNLQPSKEN